MISPMIVTEIHVQGKQPPVPNIYIFLSTHKKYVFSTLKKKKKKKKKKKIEKF